MEPILTHVPHTVSPFHAFMRGRTRVALAWVFAVALVFLARQAPSLPGIALCFVGATLRFWASGHLRKDATPAVGGPYALTRNPLYLGTYLMAVGTALAIEAWWLLGISSVLFAVVYHFIILDEETKLHEIFGAPYTRYTKLVPRFFPRPWPPRATALDEVSPRREFRKFSWELAMKNRAYEAYASFAGLIGLTWVLSAAWKLLTAPNA